MKRYLDLLSDKKFGLLWRYTRSSKGKTIEETYVYAGMTTYEKRNEKWVRTANVSTFA